VLPSTRTAYLTLIGYIRCSYFTHKNICYEKDLGNIFFLLFSAPVAAQNLVAQSDVLKFIVRCPTAGSPSLPRRLAGETVDKHLITVSFVL
jgi:hypothetical protein